MADLLMHSAVTTIEVALKNQVLLAYGARLLTPAATITALRSISSAALRSDELVYVTSKGLTYQFDRFSTAADDGDVTVRPGDNPTAGRWIKTASTVQTGYAKETRVHLGEETFKLMLERAKAQRPSFHLLFEGEELKPRSLIRGALYWCIGTWRFAALSTSFRQGAQAAEGADIASEILSIPGTHDMIGDVYTTLAGNSLGLTGVAYCEIDRRQFHVTDLGGRLVVEEGKIKVYYTVQLPDTDLVTLDSLTGITVQRQLYSSAGGVYDANNLVTSGYTVTTGASLTAAVAAGTAKVNGTAVSSTPGSRSWAANSDTYRDLHSDGSFSYTAVANGAQPPAIVYTGSAANTIRVGVTVTNASAIVWDQMLALAVVNVGSGVDYIPGGGLVSSIAITPTTATITGVGSTQKFTATATYGNGSTADISDAVAWTSSATGVATIDFTGKAANVSAGTSTISCTYGSLAGGNTATLTCN